MDKSFSDMLYLFGCGASGKEEQIQGPLNIKEIYCLSLQQGIWPIVYVAIKPYLEKADINKQDYINLQKRFDGIIAKNVRKTAFTEEIIFKMEEQGIKCCLLKGTAVADFYKYPETRISGDTDIFIKKENEKKAVLLLQECGYTVFSRTKNLHCFEAEHPIGGKLEVHVVLNPKDIDDIFFNKKVSYTEDFIIMENEISTLGVNDGLLYLTAHFIKHFVKAGAGVRQIMDLLLYMKHYQEKIDWDSYNKLMEELNYKKLINLLMAIGVKYWDMEFEGIIGDEPLIDDLLNDIKAGGIFGGREEGRHKVYIEISKQKSKLTEEQFSKYRRKHMGITLCEKFIPSKDRMEKRYNFVKKHGILLPVAHIMRWASLIAKIITRKKSIKEYFSEEENSKFSPALETRMKLIENLGIIGHQ
ncbi:MAG: nucleotidyltransferase family protein [Bacillota bacterium]|nr:nucleotidyltransferase family protein [Bacillota bacterium]